MKTTTRTVTTTVANKHQFPVSPLIIRDALPVCDNGSKVKVMLRKPDGLARATAEDQVAVNVGGDVTDAIVRWTKVVNGKGGEKDGMYEWVCGVPAGKRVELEAEWDITAPASVKWEEKTLEGAKK